MAEEQVTIEGAAAIWAVGYAIRRALAENASHIRETMTALAGPEKIPGAIRMGLQGSLNNAEELHANMWAAFETLPEAIRPDRADRRYSIAEPFTPEGADRTGGGK